MKKFFDKFVSLQSRKAFKAAFAKNNVTFTSGKNTMTLQNVKGKKITFVDDNFGKIQ